MKNSQKGFAIPLIIAIIAVLVISSGIYFLYFQNRDMYACGTGSITSKFPANYGSVQKIKTDKDTCSRADTQAKGMSPKMIRYGSASYQVVSGDIRGTYTVSVVEYANQNDAMDFVNYLKEDSLKNFQPILQGFGQNKVVWVMRDSDVSGAFWKSGNYVVLIGNQGNHNIDSELVIGLLSHFPSDNDIVLK